MRATSDSDVWILEDAEAYTFNTVCGAKTFVPPTVEPETTYEIGNAIPTLKFPIWASYTPDCTITKYELYSDADNLSPSFDQEGHVEDIDAGEVTFTVIEELETRKDDYPYIVKVTLDTEHGGTLPIEDVMFDTSQSYIFKTVCAQRTFYTSPGEALTVYQIDGERPPVTVPTYASYSEDCVVDKYELYSDAETLSAAFDQNYEELPEDPDNVEFRLIADLADHKAEYQYLVKVTVEAEGQDDVILFDTSTFYTLSVVCGAPTIIPPTIPDEQAFTIDETAPTLPIPKFGTLSEDCPITGYHIYETDGVTLSPHFDQEYRDAGEDAHEVEFTVVEHLQGTDADYDYMVQVSNEGGVIMTDLYSFSVVCRTDDHPWLFSDFEPEITYVIDGNIPTLVVPKWDGGPEDHCGVSRYEVYSDEGWTVSEAFDQDYEDRPEASVIRFKLREDLLLVKDDYTYYVKAHIEGGASKIEDVQLQQLMQKR